MAPLTDPQLLTCYRNALANWRFAEFIIFGKLAEEWIRDNLPNLTPKDIGRLMHEFVESGGVIDQQKETRAEWNMHDYHYDLRLTTGDKKIYIETRLEYRNPNDPDDPIIYVVNVHEV